MKKVAYNILPGTEEILKTMGKQIKFARAQTESVSRTGGRTCGNQPRFSVEN